MIPPAAGFAVNVSVTLNAALSIAPVAKVEVVIVPVASADAVIAEVATNPTSTRAVGRIAKVVVEPGVDSQSGPMVAMALAPA